MSAKMAAHALVCKFLCPYCAVGAGRAKQEAGGEEENQNHLQRICPPPSLSSPCAPPALTQLLLALSHQYKQCIFSVRFLVAADVLCAGSYPISSSDLVTNGV